MWMMIVDGSLDSRCCGAPRARLSQSSRSRI